MKFRQLSLLFLAAALSGCGILKQKAAEYHLGKARRTIASSSPAPADIEAAFASIDKALSYAPGSDRAVELLEELSAAAARNGYARAQELEAASLKKVLAANPANWHARLAMIDFLSARGDTGGLEAQAAQAQGVPGEAAARYCGLLAALTARSSALPWLESEGYLALNKSPEVLLEKAAAYSAAAASVQALKAEAQRLAASDPSLKSSAPQALSSAAEVASADALRDPQALKRVLDFNARSAAEEPFRKAVELSVQGNAALVKKEYSKARAFYQGALNHYPGLTDARRQLAETDFQEGASLAAVGGDRKTASGLLYRAYGGAREVIEAGSGSVLPFVKPEKFLGEVYALKAADLAALRAVEGGRLRNTTKLEAEFKAALDEALKLNPEGRLAGELLDRYNREGF
ncbi:MAG: hypothetical protein A2X31_04885 [Elusimicrobia bacterium GWB2_63_22]|nr:MAG: hypothetical protein A2X31_04885 [Elusimicrobia bacterium GWB2_63_22]